MLYFFSFRLFPKIKALDIGKLLLPQLEYVSLDPVIALPEISAILFGALHHCLVGHMNSFSTRTKLHVAPRTDFEWNATHFERLRTQLAPEFLSILLK